MSALLVALLVSLPALASDPPKLPVVPPEEAGMDARILAGIDPLVTAAIAAGEMPGCVVCIGRQGKIVLLKAYGDRQVEPERVPTTTTTVYDLASLTKPIATATSVMRLVENGKLDLSDPAASYLPDFGASGKQGVTVYHLLTHQSGLVADNPLSDYVDGPEKAWQRIFALDLRGPPGERFIYSDVGFLVLGEIVRRVSGQPLGEFARQRIFEPLGMHETGFRPSAELRSRAAPTEQRDGEWMQGKVHDPRAWLLEGVAGHAGLFSTATDLATYAQMMLGGGEYQGVRILKPETVVRMTEPYPLPRGRRGLGWDMRTGYSKNRGRTFSPQAFGHGGFTGTSLWIDPELELFVIFLSNRLHPDGQGSVNPLAGEIGTLAADAIRDRGQGDVLTGIDILRREGFRRLEGRRVGLITNQTGIDRRGTSTANLLHQALEV
ncbi:MAG: serine hydrolase, partial [Planctomycetota bacterium]